ncbi:MAG: 2-amino-4-hydroxy-6-hydroxymethyldihydropteridine diphosphokinase [Alphaproteobacteria bacterium]|nr:2-amino-4-hydroxy-6-hydroxymethyldihydropteridine diphosphokinase [Alphaproteobacteria bacterium]
MLLIGIGGNLASPRFGAPVDTLSAALVVLEAEGIQVATRSAWYRTEPVPRSDQPWFVNAVASLTTHLAAPDLLAVLQAVEEQFGRVRSERNASRVLDLDLLDHRGQVTQTASLVLPHPRLHQRRFVLLPLAEIAPDWRHPLSGLTAKQLLSRLAAKQPIERLPC